MKSRYIAFVVYLLLSIAIHAQQKEEFILEFNDCALNRTEIGNKPFYLIDMGEDFSKSTSLGQAVLPCLNRVITSSATENIQVKYTVIQKDTIFIKDGIQIAPLQKSKIKKDTAYNVCMDEKYYSENDFSGDNTVSITSIGKKGEKNISVLKVSPLRYNPVKNAIERITKLKVELYFNNEKQTDNTLKSNIYTGIAAAVSTADLHRPYKMVILTDETFKNNLSPFVKWKTEQGFDITLLTTSETGKTTEEIKSYLQDIYQNTTPLNPPFDYLFIVGDTDIVPTFKGYYTIDNYPAHYTDLYYAEYTSDILPDVFYGRISVSDTQQLNNVIEKTVLYEKGYFSDADYLNNSLLIAGKETGDNAPTFTNGQMNYAKQYLKDLTDTSVFYNPSSAEENNQKLINERLNNGNSWINYSGHGSYSGWENPKFKISNIENDLLNTDKFGIFISNCCHAGKYDEKACFTEAVVQAKLKGAVAAVGASDYTLWDEDYYWAVGSKNITTSPKYDARKLGMYDRFFHTHNENLSNQYTSMGQLVQAGCLSVTQSLSDYSPHYWEMYNLQGDPSLIPFVGIPKKIQHNLPQTLLLGTNNWEINTVPFSYVAVSCGDLLIDARMTDSLGKAVFDLSDITSEQTLSVVITKQFYYPLIDSVKLVTPDNPLITLQNIKITDKISGQKADHLTEGGEYYIDLDIINTGKHNLNEKNNTVRLIAENNVTVQKDNLHFSTINSNARHHFSNAFEFRIPQGVKNFDVAELNFIISIGNEEIRTKKILKEIFAPDVVIMSSSITINKDTVNLAVCLKNQGKKAIAEGYLSLDNPSYGLNVLNSVNPVKALTESEYDTVIFTMATETQNTENMYFDITYKAGEYEILKNYNVSLETITENFEKGFSAFEWQNDEDNPWFIDTLISVSGKQCARSKNNLADNKKSRLNLIVDNDVSSTLSFFAKVSSERDYDNFKFYIDNDPKLVLTFGYDEFGNMKDWKKYTFDIPDGRHALCFSYEKDQNGAFGSDCAWIDDVVIQTGTENIIFSAEDLLKNNIIIYPNPTKTKARIDNVPPNSDIYIINNNGKVVSYQNHAERNNDIDVSFLETGVYYVVVIKDNVKIREDKLIIKR